MPKHIIILSNTIFKHNGELRTTIDRNPEELFTEFTDHVWEGVDGYDARQNILLMEFEQMSKNLDELGKIIDSREDFQIVKMALGL